MSDAVRRMVEKRATVIEDDVARLRFVRRSIAAHEAAARRRTRFLRRSIEVHRASRRKVGLAFRIILTALLLALGLAPNVARTVRQPAPAVPRRKIAAQSAAPKVWLVEHKASVDIYSNGLRIENEFLVNTRARAYPTFDRRSWRVSGVETQPAGIVFHTTESRMAPLDPSENSRLKRNGRDLMVFIAKHRLYHFVIDRFGRVFRAVAEADYANHAGHSIWADSRVIYWNLNQSFLGLAFEAQTEAQPAGAGDIATRAQIDAARVLTEMLRSKYSIAATNCATHAQVSINPQTMRLGYHTDWAANFPFHEVGLDEGYDIPVAALTLFGFDYDSAFLKANGGRVWQGLVVAEEQLVREAAAHGTTFELYRRMLRQRFRDWKAREAHASADDATGDRL